MRIERMDLLAFGPFTNRTLDFPRGDYDLHVIVGPNEAGKSSFLRAIQAMLFGIPERTGDNFLHSNGDLRLGIVLGRRDGAVLTAIRRKGRNKTLLDRDGHALGDDALVRFAASLDERLFSQRFGLDHERLTAGGGNILAMGGELGASLFEAGSGLIGLRRILQGLEKASGELYKPQAANPRINKALHELKELKKRGRELALRGESWIQTESSWQEAQEQLRRLEYAIDRTRAEHDRQVRISRNLPLIARRFVCLIELEQLGAVPELADDAEELRKECQRHRQQAEIQYQAARDRVEQLQRVLADATVNPAFRQHRSQIEETYKNVGSYRDAFGDLPERRAECQQFRGKVLDRLQSLAPGLQLGEIDRFRLPREALKRIRGLITRHEKLTSSIASVREQLTETVEAWEQSLQRRQDRPPSLNISHLAATVGYCSELGDLSARKHELTAAVAAERQQLEEEMAASLHVQGSLTTVTRLPVPSAETIARFDRQESTLRDEKSRLDDALRQGEITRERFLREREQIEAAGKIPSADALTEARRHRDEGWRRILAAYIVPTVNPDELAERYHPGLPLPEAYEDSVRQADQLADWRQHESRRLAELESVERRLEQVAHDQADLKEKVRQWSLRFQQFGRDWAAWTQPLGQERLSPRELSAWRHTWERIRERVLDMAQMQTEQEKINRQIQEAQAALAAALTGTGMAVPMPIPSLPEMMLYSRRMLEASQQENQVNEALDHEIAALARAKERFETRLETWLGEMKVWQDDWSETLSPLNLPQTDDPQRIESILDDLDELFSAYDAMRSLEQRIMGMESRIERYRQQVQTLREQLGGLEALDGKLPDVMIDAIYEAYQTTVQTEQHKTELLQRLDEETERMREQRHIMAEMNQTMQLLCNQAQVADELELPRQEERVRTFRDLQQKIRDVEETLMEQNGVSLDKILRESEGESADGLPGKIAVLEEHLRRQEQERDQWIATAQSLKDELNRMDGTARAAEAAEMSQSVMAALQQDTEELLQLQIAISLLHQTMDGYREKNQEPLIRRSGEIFGRLTLDRFVRLETRFDEQDRAILVGIRANGIAVGVEGMSTGTVDQLYLALRLAAIERDLTRMEPLPLILDDILIQFDDSRAKAALAVIAELSRQTQVLFLTHHPHLVELAEAELPLSAVNRLSL